MNYLKSFILLALFATFLTACSNDDDGGPTVVIEEEVITTVRVTLSPPGDGADVVFLSRDADADGPNPPVVEVMGNLIAGTTYTGEVEFLNETVSPAEDVTEEVEERDEEHQVFFTPGGGLDVTTSYSNFDGNDNPLGTEFALTAGLSSTGTFTLTLIHEPIKPNNGLGDVGGEIDVITTFDVVVE